MPSGASHGLKSQHEQPSQMREDGNHVHCQPRPHHSSRGSAMRTTGSTAERMRPTAQIDAAKANRLRATPAEWVVHACQARAGETTARLPLADSYADPNGIARL